MLLIGTKKMGARRNNIVYWESIRINQLQEHKSLFGDVFYSTSEETLRGTNERRHIMRKKIQTHTNLE